MITLEQIRLLGKGINRAVQIIAALRQENNELKKHLQNSEQRVSGFQKNQLEVEQGIVAALQQLDKLESTVVGDSDGEEPDIKDPYTPQEPSKSSGSSDSTSSTLIY